MNIQQIAATHGLDREETVEIILLFIQTAGTDLKAIRLAVDREDLEGICHAAHSLKGAAGNLGLMEMFEAARAMEQDARERQLAKIRTGLDHLSDQLAEIESQMNDLG